VILLWGAPGDDPLEAVRSELDRRRTDVRLLDQRDVLDQRVELTIGASMGGTVWSRDDRFALEEVAALYVRVYDARQLTQVAQAGPDAWVRVQEVQSAIWAWADETPARVINRPTAMASNGSKPYQTTLIGACGFCVPETLITTDPAAAAAFWDRHEHVVYKSVSSVRSRVSRLGPQHRTRLADVVWCPTQFQAWVPGRDHRVHVIGDEVFAVEVLSDADDYRYAQHQGASCELRVTTLPPEIEARARATAVALGLSVAGIDLRRTPQDQWYCFEVNPSPCFTYYEHHTGQPLTAAVASLLTAAHQ
jgi:glutathione synthase/RimK-type ligase-like ATP-grasp enzyme